MTAATLGTQLSALFTANLTYFQIITTTYKAMQKSNLKINKEYQKTHDQFGFDIEQLQPANVQKQILRSNLRTNQLLSALLDLHGVEVAPAANVATPKKRKAATSMQGSAANKAK